MNMHPNQMHPVHLINAARKAGGTLRLVNGKPYIENIPPGLKEALRARRDDVAHYLQREVENTTSQDSQASPSNLQKTPGLLATIKRMAMFYGYEPDELTHALYDARRHPDRWRELVKNDVHAADFMDTPEHQLEVRAMLMADSNLRYAYTTKHVGDDVHVTLAVRDVAVADLVIPASKFDPLEFLKLLHFGGEA